MLWVVSCLLTEQLFIADLMHHEDQQEKMSNITEGLEPLEMIYHFS